MKKVIALTLMLLMMLMLVSTVGFAAKSSSSGFKSSPSSSGTYKPSAPANNYSNTAPAKQTSPGVQQNTQSQSSSGGFLRNAGMFGGGMLAGSMLGSLFGNNNMGGESSFFGMLLNILMIGAVVMGIRFLWDKYKNKDKKRDMY